MWSTRNYIQYPGIDHNGKEYEKECVCVCVFVSLRCTVEINTVNQLYFNKINLKNRNK